MDAKFIQRVTDWANALDRLDYYQILRVEPTASREEIRKAYHAQSRFFHPDRYFQLPDGPVKQGIYKISKRITEAYITLRDDEKRRHYNQQVAASQRRVLRYTQQSEQEQKVSKQQEIGKTEAGRRLYQQGLSEMKRNNFTAAERSFKMAMAYEADNQLYKKMAEEAAGKIKADYSIK